MDKKEYDRLKALNIRVYSAPWCGPCNAAKAFLDEHGVPYTSYDVTQDPERLAEMMRITGGKHGVPVICVGDKHYRGYGPGMLNKILGI